MKANLLALATLVVLSLPVLGQIPVVVDLRVHSTDKTKITAMIEKTIAKNPDFEVADFAQLHRIRNVHTQRVWTEYIKIGENIPVYEVVDSKGGKHQVLKAVGAQAARIGGAIFGNIMREKAYESSSYGGYILKTQMGDYIAYGSEAAAQALERSINQQPREPQELGYICQIRMTINWQRTWSGGSVPVQSFPKDYFIFTSKTLIDGSKYFLLPSLNSAIEDAEPLPNLDWVGQLEAKTFKASSWGQ